MDVLSSDDLGLSAPIIFANAFFFTSGSSSVEVLISSEESEKRRELLAGTSFAWLDVSDIGCRVESVFTEYALLAGNNAAISSTDANIVHFDTARRCIVQLLLCGLMYLLKSSVRQGSMVDGQRGVPACFRDVSYGGSMVNLNFFILKQD